MQFGPIPTATAQGAILAHAVRAGERLFKKGRRLSGPDIEALERAGVAEIVAVRLEQEDVPEDEAAALLAAGCAGNGTRVAAAFTGRANIYSTEAGLAHIDRGIIDRLNGIDEAITLATLPPFARVSPRQMLATVKIIPFSAPRAAVEQAQEILASGPAVRVAPFRLKSPALISTFLPSTNPALLEKNRGALDARLAPLGSPITRELRAEHTVEGLARAIEDASSAGADPILIFGASAITDRRDVIPVAIERAGGTVHRFGMPVDPGNLLLLGDVQGRTVIGLPGCARSPKLNGFDFVLWRVLADLPVTGSDIVAMGVGGLLTEIPTRPQPRDERPSEPPRAPKIAAVILAAGRSSRMGSNKLLEIVGGMPLIRHTVDAALGSHAEQVTVVTGHAAPELQSALAGLPIRFVHNPDFAGGLSTSLKCGLNALPDDVDGALVLLGDMPGIGAPLIDRMISGFDPGERRAICVATHHGRRGNPVLWARRFFPEIQAIEGDVGARNLIGQYDELVCEIEADSDAPIADIDTPEALANWRART